MWPSHLLTMSRKLPPYLLLALPIISPLPRSSNNSPHNTCNTQDKCRIPPPRQSSSTKPPRYPNSILLHPNGAAAARRPVVGAVGTAFGLGAGSSLAGADSLVVEVGRIGVGCRSWKICFSGES